MQTKWQIVDWLVKLQFSVESRLVKVIHVVSDDNTIKLIKVFDAGDSFGTLLQAYGSTIDVPYMTMVCEMSRKEFEMIESRSDILPKNWSLDNVRVFDRSIEVLSDR